MAGTDGPDKTGPGAMREQGSDDDLERRRRSLDASLAQRRPAAARGDAGPRTGGLAGLGNALRLSSEFIAGVLVGAGIGWFVDRYFETSPWGLIVFLLLGFAAGVLNVLRAIGAVAKPPKL